VGVRAAKAAAKAKWAGLEAELEAENET